MEVMEGVSNGVSGIIKVSATSERNDSDHLGGCNDSSDDHTRYHIHIGGRG